MVTYGFQLRCTVTAVPLFHEVDKRLCQTSNGLWANTVRHAVPMEGLAQGNATYLAPTVVPALKTLPNRIQVEVRELCQ